MENYKLYMHIFPNKKVYVGITKETLARRWLNGNGYRRQPVVFSAIMKYGWDNIQHILLREGMTKDQAMQAEKDTIKAFNSNDRNFGYNLTSGGDGTADVKRGKEASERMRNYNLTRNYDEAFKQKLRTANLGKKASAETKAKMSAKRKGSGNSFYGKAHSDKAKELISKANSGFNSTISLHIAKYDYDGNLICVYGSMRSAEADGYKRRNFVNIISKENFVECSGYLWRLV